MKARERERESGTEEQGREGGRREQQQAESKTAARLGPAITRPRPRRTASAIPGAAAHEKNGLESRRFIKRASV